MSLITLNYHEVTAIKITRNAVDSNWLNVKIVAHDGTSLEITLFSYLDKEIEFESTLSEQEE
jgi:hypothetical protein